MARRFDENWTQITAPAADAPASPAGEVEVAPDVGLECPVCGCRHFETTQTRPRPGIILRRKACRHCGHRITTREKIASAK